MKKPELVNLNVEVCSKCLASTPDGKDHPRAEDCTLAWRTMTAQILAATMASKKRIFLCQQQLHQGRTIVQRDMNLCTACLIQGFTAFEHTAKMFDLMPRTKGGRDGKAEGPGSAGRVRLLEPGRPQPGAAPGAQPAAGPEPAAP